MGKRQRGNQKKQCGRSTDPETEKDTEGTNYAGPSAHLAAHSGTGLGFGHGTMCPSTARSLLNCSQGRTPPSLAQDLFFELNWFTDQRSEILPSKGPSPPHHFNKEAGQGRQPTISSDMQYGFPSRSWTKKLGKQSRMTSRPILLSLSYSKCGFDRLLIRISGLELHTVSLLFSARGSEWQL